MIRSVKFASIPVSDQKRSLEFYTQKLGFTIFTDQPLSEHQRWIELKVGRSETRVVLFTPEAHKGWIGGFLNLSFTCDDVQKTYDELRERGVEFAEPPTKQPWGTYAVFKDPDGTSFVMSEG